MSETLFKVGFILVGLVLIYKLIFSGKRGVTLFEMQFKEGRLTSHKGKIPEKFQRECKAIAKTEKLTCVVRAEKAGSVRLHVSANVGDSITQRIRNQFPFEYYDKKSVDNSRQAG
ncbi:DUF3634 family protein [Shewanella sp. AS1]|uniref:DUF3634 family protein n=1 Tax=Shewanella sp. AS1 TaxID=2907626 RepID=UPI001F26840F|nr:DUF3634 family protein [Shewanella sp. AS1]MCE9677894.1 DUF3634 family protein [Shewanella sp. AS1]